MKSADRTKHEDGYLGKGKEAVELGKSYLYGCCRYCGIGGKSWIDDNDWEEDKGRFCDRGGRSANMD